MSAIYPSAHLDTYPDQLAANVLNSATEAIIATNSTRKIILLNSAAQTLTGLSAKQALNCNINRIFKGQDGVLYLIDTAMREGRSISDRETIQLKRPHAPPLPVSVTASPLYTDNGTQDGIILTLHDISSLRQLEQDVHRAERMTMLDTLAAGLAHEIKNPLGGIKGAAQLLSLELDQRQDLLEYTQVMIKETDRINGIIEELMNLTSPRTDVVSEVDLTKIISDIVLLQAQTDKGKGIRFELQLDPSIPPITGDQTLLTRLFLNLIKNATEAIVGNGIINVSTRIDTEHHLTKPGQTPTPFVVIKITDNGSGISPAVLAKIFTPFYTTKSTGSGLGLAISQKIINDHDGMLRINSHPDQGTCCSIYLPFRREKSTEQPQSANLESYNVI